MILKKNFSLKDLASNSGSWKVKLNKKLIHNRKVNNKKMNSQTIIKENCKYVIKNLKSSNMTDKWKGNKQRIK